MINSRQTNFSYPLLTPINPSKLITGRKQYKLDKKVQVSSLSKSKKKYSQRGKQNCKVKWIGYIPAHTTCYESAFPLCLKRTGKKFTYQQFFVWLCPIVIVGQWGDIFYGDAFSFLHLLKYTVNSKLISKCPSIFSNRPKKQRTFCKDFCPSL